MAKMFYTADETRNLLGKEEEELKQLTREGKLREFRDGPKVMYKSDQVDALRGEMGLGSAVDLGPSDTSGPLSLADTGAGPSGSVISLADAGSKEDTATDLGLSPSGSGVNVLGLDESGIADPSAQTSVSASDLSEGSGLLDLSKGRDDTSFGQPVLDEIRGGVGSGLAAGAGVAAAAVAPVRSAPIYVEAPDPLAPALGGAALAASLFALLPILLLVSSIMGGSPVFDSSTLPWFYLLGAGALAAIVFFVIGLILGRKK
jgi:hypothetical protein